MTINKIIWYGDNNGTAINESNLPADVNAVSFDSTAITFDITDITFDNQ